jgi:hypothetical protein
VLVNSGAESIQPITVTRKRAAINGSIKSRTSQRLWAKIAKNTPFRKNKQKYAPLLTFAAKSLGNAHKTTKRQTDLAVFVRVFSQPVMQ